jgi:predicted methyltransferase
MEREDEFLQILSDDVTLAMLAHIVETGGCFLEDILDMDAVKEELEDVVETMEECQLLERIDDTVQLTEKGKKYAELREGLEEIVEKGKKEGEV